MHKSRQFAFYLLAVLTLSLLVTWAMSYRNAHQLYRSRWQQAGTDYAEKAHWPISNYGSFGVAWRSQHFPVEGNSLPASGQEYKALPASESAFSNIHALGILPWHWFDYHQQSVVHGITPVSTGQLFVPYWAAFLLAVLLTAAVYPRQNP